MRPTLRPVATLILGALLASCSGAASTPSPTPDRSTAWLRATTTQAIPPVNGFAVGPTAVVTADGRYVTQGPVPAVFPGPLLPNLVARPVSDAGRQAILAEAERLGLLTGKTDLRSPMAVPGGVTGHIELALDDGTRSLTGDPGAEMICIMAPCDPIPGTPEAFGAFWRKIADPAAWLSAELGPEEAFVADAYAVLVGPPPAPDPAIGAAIEDWPLDVPIATFGGPVANGTHRCGIVAGEDAETLRPALEAATQSTQWIQDESTSATFGLTVRPVVAGEDPCAETFGG
jgi:hypothetical protein